MDLNLTPEKIAELKKNLVPKNRNIGSNLKAKTRVGKQTPPKEGVGMGNGIVVQLKKQSPIGHSKKETKMSGIKVDETVIPKSNNAFFKRSAPKHYLRFYPCKDDNGDLVFGKQVVCHWIDNKRFECTGALACPYCLRKEKKTYKELVGVVDRQLSSDKMQLYELPISVWIKLKKFIDENGVECLGDAGVTFCLEYDAKEVPSNQYSLSPVLKDKVKLANEDKILSFNPPQKDEVANAISTSGDLFDGVDDVVETAEASDATDAETDSTGLF